MEKGNNYIDEENYEKAIKAFNQAIEKNFKKSNALFGRGLAFFHLKRYEDALNSFNEVLQINPEFDNPSRVYYNRGEIVGKT